MTLTAPDLIAFEADIAAAYGRGDIRAPIHLSGGNEEHLIRYFNSRVDPPTDWVFSTWRSHYHALLAGHPPTDIRDAILRGRSITLTFPRFVSSAIVAGHVPMAVGRALAAYRAREPIHVHCFVGDMAARTGIFCEAQEYAIANDLPITFVIEDNGVSVRSPTLDSWGPYALPLREAYGIDAPDAETRGVAIPDLKTYLYEYTLTRPHSGTGEFIRW